MRTKLEYVVTKEKRFDYGKGKEYDKVVCKSYIFTAKTEGILHDFAGYLKENGVTLYDYFKDGEEVVYLEIIVLNTENKEYIKELYKEWKQKRQ